MKKIKLSVSNIGWDKTKDDEILSFLSEKGFNAIEIAPTILIEKNPYDNIEEAQKIVKKIKNKYGLSISSMQSIWYGKNGNIFNKEEATLLLEYTKKAIDFASSIKCQNLVFGCPKNRIKPDNVSEDNIIYFFKELGEYALSKNTILAIEPNPTIYGTNFINYTKDAFEFVKKVNSKGLKVNIDFGTIIANEENLEQILYNIELVNHIHISEPNLEKIKIRDQHKKLFSILIQNNYNNYVSIEMKKTENVEDLKDVINYIYSIFSKEC